jgi:hypothetical protein
MSSNFLAPTSSELERDWGIVLNDEWATDVVGGDYAPIIRRFGLGAAAQREAVLARFGLIPSTAKTARSPGLHGQRPVRDRGDAIGVQERVRPAPVVHHPRAVPLRAALRRRLEARRALAHPPRRPLAAQHRRPLGPLGRRRTAARSSASRC